MHDDDGICSKRIRKWLSQVRDCGGGLRLGYNIFAMSMIGGVGERRRGQWNDETEGHDKGKTASLTKLWYRGTAKIEGLNKVDQLISVLFWRSAKNLMMIMHL